MKFCWQSRVELTRTSWPIMNTADSPTQVWALLLQLTSYPWDFGDFRKCRSPWLVLELYLPLASFPARFGLFNRPGCLLYTYLHSTVPLYSAFLLPRWSRLLREWKHNQSTNICYLLSWPNQHPCNRPKQSPSFCSKCYTGLMIWQRTGCQDEFQLLNTLRSQSIPGMDIP